MNTAPTPSEDLPENLGITARAWFDAGMQKTRRALVLVTVLIGGLLGTIATAPSVFAATITSPTGNPFVVSAIAGQPQPFTVTASGYAAGDNVFIEQCDGTPSATTGWDPTTNCDLGASPAPVLADAGGVATFLVSDPNHSFHPFRGISPQGLFNCLAPGQASAANGLPDFTNCQFRVSTNNSASTSDQVFRTMTLPAPAATTAPNFTGTPTAGTVGVAYSFAFTGITGSPTPTFTVSPATIAGGIHISAAGVLSGTPTTAGSFPITVTASNGTAPNAVKPFTLVVAAASSTKIDCGVSGTIGLKPTLSNVVPKKPKANKAKSNSPFGAAAGAGCVNHAPTATKYPASSGSVVLKGSLPAGSNCSTLATLPLGGSTLKIKWKGVNPKNGKLSNAGLSLATIASVTTLAPGTYELTGPVTSGAFAGSTVKLTLRTDMTHAARLAQCQASGISGIGFTGVGGPSLVSII